jgi:manganese efflux pump family protein
VIALILVAFSVGLDNFGASTVIGVGGVDSRLRIRIAIVFGAFEAVMPLLGLLLGRSVAGTLGTHAKTVAGIVLCLVGAYTVASEVIGREAPARTPERLSLSRLLFLGGTLSIDNLAIGFALGDYHVNIVVAALVIGGCSVMLTLAGLEVGTHLGARSDQRSELVGGALLVLLGVLITAGIL